MGDQALLNLVVGGPPALILITSSQLLERETFFKRIEAALRGGTDAVLVREHQMDSAQLLACASRIRLMTREYGARLIIHSQADIADAVDADGVHVASADIGELPYLHRWLGQRHMSLSASCHSAKDLIAAADNEADFALLSPVFPTQSHPGSACLGLECFRQLADVSRLPVIGLGGITVENRTSLAGYGVAVITALLGAEDPEAAARALRGADEA